MKGIEEALLEKECLLAADFDGTLTLSGSSMYAAVHVTGPGSGLALGRDRLFQTVGRAVWQEAGEHPEDRGTLRRAAAWWRGQMELYVDEGIPESILRAAAALLPARGEGLELLRFCRRNAIPVWIVSAGLGNVIRFWLENAGFAEDDFHILANELYYEEGKPAGFGKLITPWNKAEEFFTAAGKAAAQTLVLLGDRREDLFWRTEREEDYLVKAEGFFKISGNPSECCKNCGEFLRGARKMT